MTKGTKSEGRETAVVLGASISGLLAARVLADHYGRVILVERDVPPDLPVTRRGVPQSGLPHILAARGMRIVGELFPGLSDELVAGGAQYGTTVTCPGFVCASPDISCCGRAQFPTLNRLSSTSRIDHSSSGTYVAGWTPFHMCRPSRRTTWYG